jgi:hypothetical protein
MESEQSEEPAVFVELADALEALWEAAGGERVPGAIERRGEPAVARWWPA